MPLNAQITLSIIAHESTVGDISRQMRVTPVTYALSLSNGTGANQANLVWSASADIEGLEDITLCSSGFVFSDERGTVTFSAVKVVYIKNTGTGNILWLAGPDWPSGPLGDTESGGLLIRPGGAVMLAAPDATGWTTAGSLIQLGNPTNAQQTYDVAIIGEGAVS